MAVARRTSQNVRKQYFQTKQARKTQNVWRNVVRRLRCNAFAIARFLVLHLFHNYATSDKVRINTRKRAIAKALQLEGHPDFTPVDLAYYQHFLGVFLFENIAFWDVPPGNDKCRARGATPLVNVK